MRNTIRNYGRITYVIRIVFIFVIHTVLRFVIFSLVHVQLELRGSALDCVKNLVLFELHSTLQLYMRVIVSRGFRTLVSLSLAVIYSRALVCLYNYHTSTLLSYETGVWLPKERREPFVLLVQSYFITLHYSNLAGMDIFSYVRVYMLLYFLQVQLRPPDKKRYTYPAVPAYLAIAAYI